MRTSNGAVAAPFVHSFFQLLPNQKKKKNLDSRIVRDPAESTVMHV